MSPFLRSSHLGGLLRWRIAGSGGLDRMERQRGRATASQRSDVPQAGSDLYFQSPELYFGNTRKFNPPNLWVGLKSICAFLFFKGVLEDPKYVREVIIKKLVKSRQADRLGRPPPPPKRSGKCKKFSTSCHIWGYFAIL